MNTGRETHRPHLSAAELRQVLLALQIAMRAADMIDAVRSGAISAETYDVQDVAHQWLQVDRAIVAQLSARLAGLVAP